MKARFRALLVILVLAVFVAVGVAVVFGHGPLRRVGGRACIGCVEWHWSGASQIRANRLSGEYRFAGDSDYLVRFGDGTVRLDDLALQPGCHAGSVPAGTRVRFEDAREVRVRAPSAGASCDNGPAATPPEP